MDTITQETTCILALVATLMPLLSFAGILLVPGRTDRGAFFSILNISFSLLLSVLVFIKVWDQPVVHQQLEWFTIGNWHFKAGILINNLSALMLLLISLIAALVHIYSLKYMEGDPYLFRYWAYLGLFCFSMFGLVITDSLLLLYMFWELVGFSSYLLIGFWFTRKAAVQANKKAFIMNRLGDLGFLTGIMIIFTQFQTLDISLLFSEGGFVSHATIQNGFWVFSSNKMPDIWLTIAGLAFFFGAAAKSAQFPLHTWLPDAMEGPTSVSSLIHAATMVAAGVFLLGRIYPIFNSEVLLVIAVIGAFTAFMAATIALVQNDIKRILAFSTISQLGFMMLAMGVGAYGSAIFHLITHAFFKCLLFLSAGAVIHEMHHLKEKYKLDIDHQDIRLMGGLRKFMPLTFITMLLAALALIGIPGTSGYLSKDAILIQAFEWSEGQAGFWKVIPYSALITSWLTAFYISRLIFKVFFGRLRLNDICGQTFSLHEAPKIMTYVLVALATFCLFPFFSFNPLHYEHSWIIEGLNVVSNIGRVNIYHTLIPAAVNLFAVLIIYLSFTWYVKRGKSPDLSNSALFRFAENQWYFDKIYQNSFVNGILLLSRSVFAFDKAVVDGFVNLLGRATVLIAGLSQWLDRRVVDGVVNGAGSVTKIIGNFARHFQTGRLQHYLVTMLLIVLSFFIIKYFSQAI
ncbi:NADH-quinone oxidoreductase subunit L [Desertivirga xinjiangensis]|uniref:NADH-quinone oxidoreductase subunit L n=1 Tax=Desertivirga xinjiangensis TaxID=539206 RepID=UPI00210BFFA1|nr:NADH-quinone oxidoreductase subunit L [Pedobacter xinjiangensis]